MTLATRATVSSQAGRQVTTTPQATGRQITRATKASLQAALNSHIGRQVTSATSASPQAATRQASLADSASPPSQAESTVSQAFPINSALSQAENAVSQASPADSTLSQAESTVSQAGIPQVVPVVRHSARLRVCMLPKATTCRQLVHRQAIPP